MTANEFRAWVERHGYTQAEAAEELDTTQASVSRWLSGDRTIPGPVARLVEVLERCEQRQS